MQRRAEIMQEICRCGGVGGVVLRGWREDTQAGASPATGGHEAEKFRAYIVSCRWAGWRAAEKEKWCTVTS